MSNPNPKDSGIVAKHYLTKHPSMPSLALAELMLRERPDVFRSVQHARGRIQYYRGAHGSKNASRLADTSHIRSKPGSTSDRAGSALPKPIDDLFKWQVQPVQFDRALVLCDVHAPYHDYESLRLAISYGRRRNVDCIIFNGDTMDFYWASFFDQDPNHWDGKREQDNGTQMLEYFRETFPKAQLIFKEGNHEERMWRYVARRCPGLLNCVQADGVTPLVGLAGFLPFNRLGIQLVDNKQPMIVCDKLYILHGHEFPTPFTNPVNPARGLFLQTKANAICGHLHQTSAHTETGLGHPISCFSFGALCHLRPRYRPLNKWNTGFGIIETNGGAWSVESLKIIDGRIV